MAENTAFSDYSTYVSCLGQIGMAVEHSTSRYYAIGFTGQSDGAATAFGNSFVSAQFGVTGCPGFAEGNHWYKGEKKIPGRTNTCSVVACIPPAGYTTNTFTVGAGGVIAATGFDAATNGTDQWNINQDKMLRQVTVGY